jgi:hypothetical protein
MEVIDGVFDVSETDDDGEFPTNRYTGVSSYSLRPAQRMNPGG